MNEFFFFPQKIDFAKRTMLFELGNRFGVGFGLQSLTPPFSLQLKIIYIFFFKNFKNKIKGNFKLKIGSVALKGRHFIKNNKKKKPNPVCFSFFFFF